MRNYRLPNITSLRFFLALLVVFFHIPEFLANRGFPSYNHLPIFQKGTEAVYMFFTLSGFLIIRNLFTEKQQTGTISIKNFYKRRMLRIFPLYYAVLFFGLFYYEYVLPRLGFATEPRTCSLGEAIVLGGTFFSNILATHKPGGILEILWSIGIEEQFYLLIAPAILLLPIKKTLPFLIGFTILYFILFHSGAIDFLRENYMFFYYFSLSGIFAILNIPRRVTRYLKPLRLIVFALIIFYFFTNIFKMNLGFAVYQFLSMVLFALFISLFAAVPVSFFQNKKLVYLGKISYGIYMLHAIAMHLTGFVFLKMKVQFHLSSPILFIVTYNLLTIAVTVFLAHCSYKYFESYFLKLKPISAQPPELAANGYQVAENAREPNSS